MESTVTNNKGKQKMDKSVEAIKMSRKFSLSKVQSVHNECPFATEDEVIMALWIEYWDTEKAVYRLLYK